MKHLLTLISAALMSLPLLTCANTATTGQAPAAAAAPEARAAAAPPDSTDPIDQVAKGKADRRTWVVHKVDSGSPESHMQVGDAFRLIRAGNAYRLKPLSQLKTTRWGHDPGADYFADLEKKGPKRLCGTVKIIGHAPDTHTIIVEHETDDQIAINFSTEDCSSVRTHGGTAHAEN